MSRSTTTNLGLGVWDEGDNPGAGSKTVESGNTGLNGDVLRIDAAVGTGHTVAGAHKSDVIDGPNLKTTAADGTTIELTGSPLKLSIKAGGVGTTQLADDGVTAAKLADACIDAAAKLASDVVTTAKILDANVTHNKLAADAVESDNISHDNTRTKIFLGFAIAADTDGTYGTFAGMLTTASKAPCMPRAGSITKVTVCSSTGNTGSVAGVYGTYTFAALDKITVYLDASAADTVKVYKNGSFVAGLSVELAGASWFVVLEVELDD